MGWSCSVSHGYKYSVLAEGGSTRTLQATKEFIARCISWESDMENNSSRWMVGKVRRTLEPTNSSALWLRKRVALCISDLPRGAFHFRLYRPTTTDTGVESGRLSSETLKSYISNFFTSRQALITYIAPIISKILQQECGSTVALQIYMAPDLNSRPICFSFQPSLAKPGCTGPSSFDVVNESIPSSA